MAPQYLIRFDDACSTDNTCMWDKLENECDLLDIKPIVCVIPDSRDPHLEFKEKDPLFWDRIKRYQAKGYAIALHGYQHLVANLDYGITPILKMSEFAGLSLNEQKKKISEGYIILKNHGISPALWVSPFHSYDKNTIQAILDVTPIRVMSDSFGIFPYEYLGMKFVPMQMWNMKYFPFGVWTVCVHPNDLNDMELQSFLKKLHRFRKYIVTLDLVLREGARVSVIKSGLNSISASLMKVKRRITNHFKI